MEDEEGIPGRRPALETGSGQRAAWSSSQAVTFQIPALYLAAAVSAVLRLALRTSRVAASTLSPTELHPRPMLSQGLIHFPSQRALRITVPPTRGNVCPRLSSAVAYGVWMVSWDQMQRNVCFRDTGSEGTSLGPLWRF